MIGNKENMTIWLQVDYLQLSSKITTLEQVKILVEHNIILT